MYNTEKIAHYFEHQAPSISKVIVSLEKQAALGGEDSRYLATMAFAMREKVANQAASLLREMLVKEALETDPSLWAASKPTPKPKPKPKPVAKQPKGPTLIEQGAKALGSFARYGTRDDRGSQLAGKAQGVMGAKKDIVGTGAHFLRKGLPSAAQKTLGRTMNTGYGLGYVAPGGLNRLAEDFNLKKEKPGTGSALGGVAKVLSPLAYMATGSPVWGAAQLLGLAGQGVQRRAEYDTELMKTDAGIKEFGRLGQAQPKENI